jgi:hypothetical protein
MSVNKDCDWCGFEHEVKEADIRRGWGRTCSKSCSQKLKNAEENVKLMEEYAKEHGWTNLKDYCKHSGTDPMVMFSSFQLAEKMGVLGEPVVPPGPNPEFNGNLTMMIVGVRDLVSRADMVAIEGRLERFRTIEALAGGSHSYNLMQIIEIQAIGERIDVLNTHGQYDHLKEVSDV